MRNLVIWNYFVNNLFKTVKRSRKEIYAVINRILVLFSVLKTGMVQRYLLVLKFILHLNSCKAKPGKFPKNPGQEAFGIGGCDSPSQRSFLKR